MIFYGSVCLHHSVRFYGMEIHIELSHVVTPNRDMKRTMKLIDPLISPWVSGTAGDQPYNAGFCGEPRRVSVIPFGMLTPALQRSLQP